MDFIKLLQSRPGAIVIVDDHFADPDVSRLDAGDLTRFYEMLDLDAEKRNRVARMVGLDEGARPSEIVGKAEADASVLWERYRADEAAYADLATMFSTPKLLHEGEIQKLGVIAEFFRSEVKVEPATFKSLEDAAATLDECVVAFVDFYLHGGTTEKAAVAAHKVHSARYRRGFTHEKAEWPKIVFLISSKLPGQEQLQEFRTETGLRSAFYTPLRKGDVTPDVLRRHMEIWSQRYASTAQLNHYLTAMTMTVRSCADSLIADIERLELHDLTMLEALKLSAERESLQGYLTWLLSESLAAKVRSGPGLQSSLLPTTDALTLLDGKLMPSSILFELFSDIAISPTSVDETKPAFGDIYAANEPGIDTLPKSLLLVISPACDLIRCDPGDEVLCVRGAVTKADASMGTLLTKRSLFGKGNHVVRYKTTAGSEYAHIAWTLKKGLVTLSANDLMSADKFRKVARLSEVFAQEVKELTLADVSRVGTPVDPVFAVAGSVWVRMNFVRGKDEEPIAIEHDLSERAFISAVITKGRIESGQVEPQEVLVFTQQFVEWLMEDLFPSVHRQAPQYPAKLEQVENFFRKRTSWHIALNNSHVKTECDGALQFRYGNTSSTAPCASNRFEIIVSAQ